MRKIFKKLLPLTIFWLFKNPNPALARIDDIVEEKLPTSTPQGIYNPAINPSFGYGEGSDILAQLIANALKVVFSIAGVILLAMLLFGGIQWMTAGGDKEQLTKAQGRVTSALIGFLIFMSVFAIINFLAPALGFDFLQILKIEWPTP